jgi:hypothetical protein
MKLLHVLLITSSPLCLSVCNSTSETHYKERKKKEQDEKIENIEKIKKEG